MAEGGVALIPARSGSKGIKNKNVASLGGRPLLQYTTEAAQSSGVFERIVVSSDAAEILALAGTLGVEGLARPAELADDNASSDAVVGHFIAALGLAARSKTPVVLLQPTSPLRSGAQIAKALTLWHERRPRGVVSVCEPNEHPAKAFRLDEWGFLAGLFGPDAPFTPRQSLPRAYMPNGAIYVFSVEAFLEQDRIPRTGLLPLVMDSRSSIDIDSAADLRRAEQYLQRA